MSSFGNNARSFYFTQPGDQFDRLVGELYGIEASSSLKETIRFNNPHILDWNRFPPGACIEVSPSHSDPISVTHWRDDAPRAAAQWVALDREVKEVIEVHPDIISQFLAWAGYGLSLASGLSEGVKKQAERIAVLLKEHSSGLLKSATEKMAGSSSSFADQLRRANTSLRLQTELNQLNSLLRERIVQHSETEFSLFSTNLNRIRKHLVRLPASQRQTFTPFSTYIDNVASLTKATRMIGFRATVLVPIFLGGVQIHRAKENQKTNETFKVAGNVALGAFTGTAAYSICTALMAPSTFGSSPLWCGLVFGGAGGILGSAFGEDLGNRLYYSGSRIMSDVFGSSKLEVGSMLQP